MMHKLSLIGEHSVCLDLLPQPAFILDAGCRGFEIQKYFSGTRNRVYSLDIDKLENGTIQHLHILDVNGNTSIRKVNGEFPYFRAALAHYNGLGYHKYHEDKQATQLIIPNPTEHKLDDSLYMQYGESKVYFFDSEKWLKVFNIEKWDWIKMDIEGSEYPILLSGLMHPLATQISVEFHEHTNRAIGKEKLDELLLHLSKWYYIYNQNWESRHGAGFNYWDIVLISKSLDDGK